MKSYTVFKLVLISLIPLILLQSCATILAGRSNSLVFETTTPSTVLVFVDDSLVGNASEKIVLQKGVIQHGSVLELRAKGFKSEEYTILLKPHPVYVVADIVIGAIPLIIDFGTGDILRPSPRKFEFELEQE